MDEGCGGTGDAGFEESADDAASVSEPCCFLTRPKEAVLASRLSLLPAVDVFSGPVSDRFSRESYWLSGLSSSVTVSAAEAVLGLRLGLRPKEGMRLSALIAREGESSQGETERERKQAGGGKGGRRGVERGSQAAAASLRWGGQ